MNQNCRFVVVRKLLLILLLAPIQACGYKNDGYHEAVQDASKKTVLIEFHFPVGYEGKSKYSDPHEIAVLLEWMSSAAAPKYVASYPDALIPAAIILQDGASINFRISTPNPSIQYTVIKFKGNLFVAPPFPNLRQ